MIFVIATLTIAPGSRALLEQAVQPCLEATRKEAGCLSYDMFASASDPETMVFVERWQSRAHLTAHSKTPHLAEWRAASGPHVVKRVIEIIHPEKTETF